MERDLLAPALNKFASHMESKSGPEMTKAWSPMIFVTVLLLVAHSVGTVQPSHGLCLVLWVLNAVATKNTRENRSNHIRKTLARDSQALI